LATGSERDQPMSLFFRRQQNERSAQLGNLTITTWTADHAMMVVNSETLQGGAWKQPQVWTDKSSASTYWEPLNLLNFGQPFPRKVVGSRNGSILILPNHLAIITPKLSMVAPYPGKRQPGSGLYASDGSAQGSITGMVTTTLQGAVFRIGLDAGNLGGTGTPCGRYILAAVDVINIGSYEIRSLEDRRPLFRLNRLAALNADPVDQRWTSIASIQLLQDDGPAVIRSRGGRLLEFVALDIPRLALELAPDNFHVTSQPMPVLFEGGTYEYQIQVNNPALVSGFKLREAPPNATVSQTGLVRFSSPQNVRAPLQLSVSIEITAKNGRAVVHQFPIVVLPRTLPAPASQNTRPPSAPSGFNPLL
jgi:hypothetical protein